MPLLIFVLNAKEAGGLRHKPVEIFEEVRQNFSASGVRAGVLVGRAEGGRVALLVGSVRDVVGRAELGHFLVVLRECVDVRGRFRGRGRSGRGGERQQRACVGVFSSSRYSDEKLLAHRLQLEKCLQDLARYETFEGTLLVSYYLGMIMLEQVR